MGKGYGVTQTLSTGAAKNAASPSNCVTSNVKLIWNYSHLVVLTNLAWEMMLIPPIKCLGISMQRPSIDHQQQNI